MKKILFAFIIFKKYKFIIFFLIYLLFFFFIMDYNIKVLNLIILLFKEINKIIFQKWTIFKIVNL